MSRFLIVIFPLVLALFEGGFRFVLQQDTLDFLGPSLCVAALSFLIPLTELRQTKVQVQEPDGSVTTVIHYDHGFVSFIQLMIFLFLFAWGAALYLAIKKSPLLVFDIVPVQAFIGALLYVLSVAFMTAKER